MKYFIVAGERSGDLHASKLVKSLKLLDQDSEFQGWGGDFMENEGVYLKKHYKTFSVMGFWEVIEKFFSIRKLLMECKEDIVRFKPDRLVLVDFGGFNLRIARYAFENGIDVTYYIPPKTWAWNEGRVRNLKKYCNRVLCILPFEESYFQKHGVNSHYVGNPSVEEVPATNHAKNRTNKIALLPGSRSQEIRTILPILGDVLDEFPEMEFELAAVSNVDSKLYEDVSGKQNCKIIEDNTFSVLADARVAIVTSGTATLETALMGIPQVVCYVANPISYLIGKRFVKVKYISLVNLIANKQVVKELIQGMFTAENLTMELKLLLDDKVYVHTILNGYNDIREALGTKKAADNAAFKIVNAS